MPEVEIRIGGRAFEVSCQEGEEHYLMAAAAMLDTEAATLSQQIGRLPEARMLLMAGLMLADKTAGVEDKLREAEARMADMQAEIERLKSAPAPEPERIEVPVIPPQITETMAELAARAESLADRLDENAKA
ncbi:cell division protein ZapA [Lutimaribacter sp. EGI FJ00015]|uniref:Cell division protein ZapA n=1 Tax=Lutimaribacter degradans TaxID=2945989 RepID=A0ACC5ZVM7_9RHOB|nr:cell division protein ZapA [Lutimaribacter sp. EGI FJ00013]MCM2562155.1 cell division protein ZapA [Lutimaribacter sp. EGI FJ00013]MCO0613309.1 cell division protein ZapA [Lutimaribacter sp. EGI FJ00015]MCO0636285.1 cell division protein ZapA [Lutimaribacter sp. EGI FJ00014]